MAPQQLDAVRRDLDDSDLDRHDAGPPDGGPRMVGRSPVFLHTLERLRLASRSDAPVLLQGETGTGKELAASYIHNQSARRDRPFLTLDCTVLTESLFESEVFGYERGAFTGCVGSKRGLFELADSGTLLLDEIGELSPTLQAKLLRLLETGEFRRLGGRQVLRADARIICATNQALKDARWFRSDLYYRIACFSVYLPSLRERLTDIPDLARALLGRIEKSMGRGFRLAPDALELLSSYPYPGNVRELRNILWVAAAQSVEHGEITAEHIAAQLCAARAGMSDSTETARRRTDSGPSGTLSDLESRHIARLLDDCNGNRRVVADRLGISERTLYRKLKRYDLR